MKRPTPGYLSCGGLKGRSIPTTVVLLVLSMGLGACLRKTDQIQDAAVPDAVDEKCSGDDCKGKPVGPNDPDGDVQTVRPPILSDANLDGANTEDSETKDCNSDDDCDDGVFCNGRERCAMHNEGDASEVGVCVIVNKNPCVVPEQCNEQFGRCDCDLDNDGRLSIECEGTDCDDDGDGVECELCGGGDCDDRDAERFRGNNEVCDEHGKDEDCDPDTFYNETERFVDEEVVGIRIDEDGDGYINAACYNVDSEGDRIGGNDCDDTRFDIKPGVDEVCDGKDNDCDGLTDEDENESAFGLRKRFCIDSDGDRWGNKHVINFSCTKPNGFVEYHDGMVDDCDDEDEDSNPGHPEICDGKDNDCDGTTDQPREPGRLLFDQPTFTDTDLECIEGEWEITRCPADKLHCAPSVLVGCETDATTLSTCRDCATNCLFSCGEHGCDEIESISVGYEHVCALTKQNIAACWGRNFDGRLGDDSGASSSIPTPVALPDSVTDIATGSAHTCAIIGTNSALYCWGSNTYGQLGIVDIIESSQAPKPTAGVFDEPNLTTVSSIAAGSEHTCAVYDGGSVACWGNQLNGRLGNGTSASISEPLATMVFDNTSAPVISARQVVAGESHTCVNTLDNRVMCWGDNSSGQLGDDGSVLESALAQEVPGLENIESLAAGLNHTCALDSTGHVFCWGKNAALQLGHASGDDNDFPVEVPGLSDIQAIAAGFESTCARKIDGSLLCWGSNYYGERGDDSIEPSAEPNVVSIDSVDRIAAGGYTTCARTLDTQVYCWGYNFFGQLGNGTTSANSEPTARIIRALRGSMP